LHEGEREREKVRDALDGRVLAGRASISIFVTHLSLVTGQSHCLSLMDHMSVSH